MTRDAGICHTCHHGSADQIDHVTNWATSHDDSDNNLAPIHGSRCPHCDRRCHHNKTQAEAKAAQALRGRRRTREQHPGLI